MRVLTDCQFVILWEIDDTPERVWRRDEKWFLADLDVTTTVKALLIKDMIELTAGHNPSLLAITPKGQEALARRDYFQVIDRFNSK